jgi:predicted ABC-type transport system involved in lysophospholipase L1 biosynthesis ATPase subunit
VIAEEDGYVAESDAARCSRVWASSSRFTKGPMKELTGGYKLRVLLAQALFGKPEACCSTSPPTTSTSTRFAGSSASCTSTRAC